MVYSQVFGCWFVGPSTHILSRTYLPQIDFQAHTTIQSTASRTKLRQTFVNNTSSQTPEVQYSFPLYDGVSVVSFKCTIGNKVIFGIVKEKNEARDEYKRAVDRGEAAGLLEQSHEASDVFSTKIGNIPKGGRAVVEIEYVGELKHDAQLDGVRYTIPTSIAPRYGTLNSDPGAGALSNPSGKIEILIDVEVDEGAHIQGVSSPSHPIAMTMGRTSIQKDTFQSNCASATLSLGTSELGKDFVIVVNAQEHSIPRALLEDHPDILNHRALMTTLVPKFNLPNIHPEIVFVVDRSGSMGGKIPTLVEALKVFLKSLPLSAKFNICSFGSHFSFLFPKSRAYDERSLQQALQHLETFDANYGGTDILEPVNGTVKNRLEGIPLEIMVLTDGEIWNQQELFDYVNEAAKSDVRLFSLGIGSGASTSLVEGLARSGNGFAQFVQNNEKIDKGVVRMLKAALSPHIKDYRLEVKYDEEATSSDDDFEIVEPETQGKKTTVLLPKAEKKQTEPVSLFDPNFEETATNPAAGRYDHLPTIDLPKELQAPNEIHGLFPYNRTSAYLLLPHATRNIKSAVLRGTYNNAPVQLEIPVQHVGTGKTIHQLAAKRAMLETEEGRGWLSTAKGSDDNLLKNKHQANWDRIIEREAVRLGVTFQVAGKYCSFVAVEGNVKDGEKVLDISNEESNHPSPPAYSLSSFSASLDTSIDDTRSAGIVKCKKSSLFSRKSRSTSANQVTPQPPGGMAFGALSTSTITPSFGGAAFFGAPSTNTITPSFGGAGFGGPNTNAAAPKPSGGLFGRARTGGGLFGGFAKQYPASSYSQAARVEAIESKEVADESDEDMGFGLFDSAPSVSKKKKSRAAPPPPAAMMFGGAAPPASSPAPPAPSRASDTVEDKMHKLIGLQRFNGSWTAGDALFKLTEVWKGDFDDADIGNEDETIKATVLAIAWLEKEAAQHMEIWEMIVDKAKQWLVDSHGISDVETIVRRAVTVFFP